jgi:hypothetical protein
MQLTRDCPAVTAAIAPEDFSVPSLWLSARSRSHSASVQDHFEVAGAGVCKSSCAVCFNVLRRRTKMPTIGGLRPE